MVSDTQYYATRALEERQRANDAENPNARECHLLMAEAYDLRVRAIMAMEARRAFHLVSAA